jgi:hypothetical protein
MLATLNRGAGGSVSAVNPVKGARIAATGRSTRKKRVFVMRQTNEP